MDEFPLSIEDKKRIRDEIRLGSKFSLFVTIGLLVLIIISGIFIIPFFGFNEHNFLYRVLGVIGLILFPFIIVSFRNLVWYYDIKAGKKISFTTSNYKAKKTNEGEQIIILEPLKLKIEAEYLLPHLRLTEPIKVEVTKYNKKLYSFPMGKIIC